MTDPTDSELIDPADRYERLLEWLTVGIDDRGLRVLAGILDHLFCRIENLESATATAVATPMRRHSTPSAPTKMKTLADWGYRKCCSTHYSESHTDDCSTRRFTEGAKQ